MLRPVNSNHGLLKNVQSLSVPAIQIRTGAASATIRNRDSLSRNSVCRVTPPSLSPETTAESQERREIFELKAHFVRAFRLRMVHGRGMHSKSPGSR